MDIQLQNRPRLEAIQEESEEEDETEGSETGGGEEDFQIPEGVETKEVMAEEQSDDDEDDAALLRVMRPRRLSRSLSQESFLQIQSASNHQEEMTNISELDRSAVDLGNEDTPPRQKSLGHEKMSSSGELRIKVSKLKWQKHKPPEPSVQKKTNRKTNRKSDKEVSLVEEPFPEWLVDLMVNIEEATTHRLVVE